MTKYHNNIFISFEGPEGCGKTTQIQRLANKIKNLGLKFITTREPGGTVIGEKIRNLLKYDSQVQNICIEAELLLFAASRVQLVQEVIQPSLLRGEIVLCDRFIDSTIVYQGIVKNISLEFIEIVNKFSTFGLVPDLTIILDIPVELSLKRIKKRNINFYDRLEKENIDFYESIRQSYLMIANKQNRFYIIDGSLHPNIIEEKIYNKFTQYLFHNEKKF